MDMTNSLASCTKVLARAQRMNGANLKSMTTSKA